MAEPTVFSVVGHECKRPAITDLDHNGSLFEMMPMVSRMCLTCGTHWYGNAGMAVFEIPQQHWEGWFND